MISHLIFLQAPSSSNSNRHSRPNSAGATRRPAGSGYASNNPQTAAFYSDQRADPRFPKQGSNGSGGGGGSSNRPSSAGHRSSSSDPKKRQIWTPNGIQIQQTEKKDSPQVAPPGYARPKSAGMGRSKSQGISKYANEEPSNPAAQYLNQKDRQIPNPVLSGRQQQPQPSFTQQLPTRPTLDQYANPPNDRWSSSYRTQYGVGGGGNSNSGSLPATARPTSSNTAAATAAPQYYPRAASTGASGGGGGKEVVLDETISFQGINLSNGTGGGQDSNSFASTGGSASASSRIRAAINLGNQYNQQVKQRTQVVEDVIAVAKERDPISAQQDNSPAVGGRPVSAGATNAGTGTGGYAEMRPRMIKTIHNSTQPSSSVAIAVSSSNKSHGNGNGNMTERTENDGEGAAGGEDIDDHENGELEDDDDDILGEGRGGLGTEEGGAAGGRGHRAVHQGQGQQLTDSRSYGHTTNPEVSTPSLSIELGQQSSLSAHLHHSHLQNSIDMRHGSSSIEEMPSENLYPFRLTTLPNQFCSMKEALELQKIILSCRYDPRSGQVNGTAAGTAGGAAAAALMDMYMVGKIVGVGSYGKVRAAWHRLTSCKVAIKTYDKAKLKDPEHWKRVQVSPSLSSPLAFSPPVLSPLSQSEIKIMEQISHPRIARLYEAVETPKRMHLIMECLDGGNLCSYVKSKKRLSEDESRRIFFQLIQALDYLHQHCIIHRDIKLENVLFDKNKDIKLIDFGFSTVSPDGKKLKVFCGTPSYMAPEIVKRTEYEGKPVDIWGLGILLYALLCGCFPFRAKTYPDLYRRIARGSFTIPDELSSSVRDLLRQLLTVDAYTRITTTAILRHPWLHTHLATAPDMQKLQTETAILISQHPIDDINEGIIQELVDFGVGKDEVVRQVMSKTHSSLGTLYYLLLHTLKGDGHRHKTGGGGGQGGGAVGGGVQGGAGGGGHHVVSSGMDVTRKYSNAGAVSGTVNGAIPGASYGNGNEEQLGSAGTGKAQFRPHSASANRPIPQPILSSQQHSNGNPHQQYAQHKTQQHRPRSASAGRSSGGHRHYQ
jgi:serine/threonine protein kinase